MSECILQQNLGSFINNDYNDGDVGGAHSQGVFFPPRAQPGMVALSELRPRGASWWSLGSFYFCFMDLGDWPMGRKILAC